MFSTLTLLLFPQKHICKTAPASRLCSHKQSIAQSISDALESSTNQHPTILTHPMSSLSRPVSVASPAPARIFSLHLQNQPYTNHLITNLHTSVINKHLLSLFNQCASRPFHHRYSLHQNNNQRATSPTAASNNRPSPLFSRTSATTGAHLEPTASTTTTEMSIHTRWYLLSFTLFSIFWVYTWLINYVNRYRSVGCADIYLLLRLGLFLCYSDYLSWICALSAIAYLVSLGGWKKLLCDSAILFA